MYFLYAPGFYHSYAPALAVRTESLRRSDSSGDVYKRQAKPSDPHANAVAKVCRQIEASLSERSGAAENHTLKLSALASSAGISTHQLERAFQRLLSITPRQYADAQRMERLKSQLRKGDDVTTALYDAGFGSSSRLYERAPEQLGMTPATYRRGGKGMQIGYTIVALSLIHI